MSDPFRFPSQLCLPCVSGCQTAPLTVDCDPGEMPAGCVSSGPHQYALHCGDEGAKQLKPPASGRFLRSPVVGADVPPSALTPRDLHAGYLFGVVGRIDAPCIGYVEEPDIDAFHWVEGPMQPTYRITFYQKDLWEGYQVCPHL